MPDRKRLSRKTIYQEIWDSSAHDVAKKYHLKYSKFLKSCHLANIPLPSSKYLIYRQMGKDLTGLKRPLPKSNHEYFWVSVETDVQDQLTTKDNVSNTKQILTTDDIAEQFRFLNDPVKEKQIAKVLQLANSRKRWSLTPSVRAYKQKVKEYNNHPEKHQANRYNYYYEEKKPKEPKFISDVSVKGMHRVYKLMNMVTAVFSQIGEQVDDNLTITIGKDEIQYEIKEDQDKVPHALTKDEEHDLAEYHERTQAGDWFVTKPRIRKYDHPYNGHLRIRFMINASYRRYVKDKPNLLLEDQLSKIILSFYQTYIETKKEREKREEKQRIEEEQERQRELHEKQVKEYKQKVFSLINEAKDFRLANDIRKYLGHLKQTDQVDADQLNQLSKIADWVDPLISEDNDLLQPRKHGDSDKDKERYLTNETDFGRQYFRGLY